tara:strand:+ start:88 stop:663 length:576 start_codon:yes stop_codon:yes gene_type:complete
MTNDVNIIGRSNTAKSKEMTQNEITSYFGYSQRRSWNNGSCYYSLYSSRGTENFLGYRHTPTGVIFSHYTQRSDTMGSTIYNLDGSINEKIQWRDNTQENGWNKLLEEMDAIDSNRMNWDVVRMSAKPSLISVFADLYMLDNNNRLAKGDLSMLFDVDEVLQKGCKDFKLMSIDITSKKIEQKDNIKEMIV